MSNRLKRGDEAAPMIERHGRKGHVTVWVSIPPELKTELVEYCGREGVRQRGVIEAALRLFLSKPGAEQRRWYGA